MTGPRPLTTADTRITIGRRTARWDDREPTVADAMDFWSFAAGAANVVMQLSRPGVGHGVAESKVTSGSLMHHPWKRARTTFSYLAVAILGTDADRAAFRAAVDGAHRLVRSTPESPVQYNAFDRDLQMWVAACLFVGLEDTYQLLRGELSAEHAEIFYRSAFTLGTTLQVGEEQWPPTRAGFDDYWNTACAQVAIEDTVRAYLNDLLNLRMITGLLRPGFGPLLRFLTAGFLAPVFREALGVPWSPRRQRWFERLFLLVSLANRFLPKFIRQGGSQLLLSDIRRRTRRGKRLI
ncbi:oxygenase MpaB family protein [[Mycobacterium] burgundiense]|uniref:Oxygenase MpaB family protein n=1 Tax=[Mycobacterium] burgundiense TaxID=3064286 RepID=A0ABN9NMQ5_9MYCO|nr:oxygenase MpaB family protein [Mycolicibacterium sp. MU0053]CAJ1509196.1 oxygenase MpaB family protein [Mycolicibacterium sp. MU0053]